eukprot:417937-Alexandrium_andersonii.AAC.1
MNADLPHVPPGECAHSPGATATRPPWSPLQLALRGRSRVLPSAMRAQVRLHHGLGRPRSRMTALAQ